MNFSTTALLVKNEAATCLVITI